MRDIPDCLREIAGCPAIGISLLIFGDEVRLGRGHEQIFTVNLVAAFGEEADVCRRGGTQIENAKRSLG